MKKITIVLFIVALTFVTGCSAKTSFIIDDNGHKQYKDKDGNFIKEGWAEISGGNYYFDLNGYLVTNQWVDNEYYVNSDGKMETNYWYDDGNGTQYYLDENGKYVRDCIKNIDGKEYVFNKDGLRVKNGVFIDSNTSKGYYIDAQGNIDKNAGYKVVGESNYCFVNESGEIIVNEWKDDDSKWYYYGSDGLMVKNNFVDSDFYVNEKGEMVCNTELKIGDNIYIFDSDGHGKIKQEKKVSFNELVNKHCIINYDGSSFLSPDFTVSKDDSTLEVEAMFSKFNVYGITTDMYIPVDNNTRIADVATKDNNTLKAIGNINKDLNFPSAVLTQIKNTSAKDGMKTVTSGGVTLTWTVNTSYGHNVNLHLTYSK